MPAPLGQFAGLVHHVDEVLRQLLFLLLDVRRGVFQRLLVGHRRGLVISKRLLGPLCDLVLPVTEFVHLLLEFTHALGCGAPAELL